MIEQGLSIIVLLFFPDTLLWLKPLQSTVNPSIYNSTPVVRLQIACIISPNLEGIEFIMLDPILCNSCIIIISHY